MKKLILILLVFVALTSCEKDMMYVKVQVKTKNPDLVVSIGQNSVRFETEYNYDIMESIIEHDQSGNFYINAMSSDSLSLVLTSQYGDTLFNISKYQVIIINEKI